MTSLHVEAAPTTIDWTSTIGMKERRAVVKRKGKDGWALLKSLSSHAPHVALIDKKATVRFAREAVSVGGLGRKGKRVCAEKIFQDCPLSKQT